jgi:hypothetical protein
MKRPTIATNSMSDRSVYRGTSVRRSFAISGAWKESTKIARWRFGLVGAFGRAAKPQAVGLG